MTTDYIKKIEREIILKLLCDRAGICLDDSKSYLIDSRLLILKEKKKYNSVEEIIEKIVHKKSEETILGILSQSPGKCLSRSSD